MVKSSTTTRARLAASCHPPVVHPGLRLTSALWTQDISIHPLLHRTAPAKARRCADVQRRYFTAPVCSEGHGKGYIHRSSKYHEGLCRFLTLPQRVAGSDGGRGHSHRSLCRSFPSIATCFNTIKSTKSPPSQIPPLNLMTPSRNRPLDLLLWHKTIPKS